VSDRFTGSPDPQTAAAIIACVEAAFGTAAAPAPARMPAWRQAGIRENLAASRRAEPGTGWRAAIAGPWPSDRDLETSSACLTKYW